MLRSNYGERYQTIYWKRIAGMRDVIGHGYDSFDHESIWPMLIEPIPESESICKDILSKWMWIYGQFLVVVICIAIRSINCFLQINLQKTGYKIWSYSIWHIESLMSRTIQNGYSSSYSFHSLYLASHFSASLSSGFTPMPSAYMCANSFHARLCPLSPASRNSSKDLL